MLNHCGLVELHWDRVLTMLDLALSFIHGPAGKAEGSTCITLPKMESNREYAH